MALTTIAICALNEEKTLNTVLERTIRLAIEKEVLIVDDGSSDKTGLMARDWARRCPDVKVLTHSVTRGKGAAIQTALSHARGEYFAIQDADLEYEPQDIAHFVGLMQEHSLDVIFGSRFLKENPTSHWRFKLANQMVSRWVSLLTRMRVTDAYSGRKIFKTMVLSNLNIRSHGFELEVEFAAKVAGLAHAGAIRFEEYPISYCPRSIKEGKKINYIDGLKAFWFAFKFA